MVKNSGDSSNITFIEPDSEDYSKKIDKAFLLLRQIDRIAKVGTFGMKDQYVNGVEILKDMLSKEIEEDEPCSQTIAQLKIEKSRLMKKVSPEKREEAENFYNYQMNKKIFAAMMGMMRRKGLTPEEEVVDYV